MTSYWLTFSVVSKKFQLVKMVAFSLPTFKPGMATEVRFIALESGAPAFNVMKDDANYMIHVVMHFDQKAVVISTKKDNKWDEGVKVGQCDYGPGDDIAIRVEARDDHFLVYINGKEIYQLKYRYPLSDIKLAKLFPHEAKTISYSVFWS